MFFTIVKSFAATPVSLASQRWHWRHGGRVLGPMGSFSCRLGLPIGLPRPYKAHSLVEAASADAFFRPSRPLGWLTTHCEPITYVQSSAQKAQRITRNALSISEIPATLGTSSMPPSASSPHNHAPPPCQQQAFPGHKAQQRPSSADMPPSRLALCRLSEFFLIFGI